MNIAILSDNQNISMQLESWIKPYCELYNVSSALLNFNKPEELLDMSKNFEMDLVFICQRGEQGFLNAQNLKKQLPNSKMVFISESKTYAIPCLRLHFTDYIITPLEFKNFVRAMKLAGIG